MKVPDNEAYVRENLAKDYEQELQTQKMNYLKERENRINMEQEELLREKQRIEYEDQLEKERKEFIKKKQYQEYLEGMQAKENKLQKEFEEKLKPLGVSLPMNSDERLKSYHNNVYKLSDKADRNRKLFMEYNEKSKNDKYYNYLSKRYTLNKEANQTIPNNKDIPKSYNTINNDYINKNNNDEGLKNQTFNNTSNNNITDLNNYYNNSYNKYKNLYKEYNNYNKILAENNIRKKELMNKQRALQEEKRIEESERLSQLEKQEKLYENEKKKLYRDYLDRQVNQQIPIKLSMENYDENNVINSQTSFKNTQLYDAVPHYSTINKSKFVEVNPFCSKNYDLGRSNLESNPILNPMFNYNYNKYLFNQANQNNKGRVTRSMSDIPNLRAKDINIYN
jgi:hypothetical protein